VNRTRFTSRRTEVRHRCLWRAHRLDHEGLGAGEDILRLRTDDRCGASTRSQSAFWSGRKDRRGRSDYHVAADGKHSVSVESLSRDLQFKKEVNEREIDQERTARQECRSPGLRHFCFRMKTLRPRRSYIRTSSRWILPVTQALPGAVSMLISLRTPNSGR
jgi:hypothetical protein